MSWWRTLFGRKGTTEERAASVVAHDAIELIDSLADGDKTAVSALSAENWRLLPAVLSSMHRTMSDLCANARLLDDDAHRRIVTTGDKHQAVIKAIGAPGVEPLAQVLHHENPDARAGASYALQMVGLTHTLSPDILQELGRLASAGTASDRGPATTALSALAKKQNFSSIQDVLALLLAHEDPSIRWDAAKMIDDSRVHVTDTKCVEALASLLADKTLDVLVAGRDAFGGPYDPPSPEIPPFLHQAAQVQLHPAGTDSALDSAPVRVENGGIDLTLTLTSGSQIEEALSRALRALPVGKPKWIKQGVQDVRMAWVRFRTAEGSFREILAGLMECCASDQQKYLACDQREDDFRFQMTHHWIQNPYDPQEDRLSFCCGLGLHNVWRTSDNYYVAMLHE